MKSKSHVPDPQFWKTDLAELWGVPHLPSVFCETQIEGRGMRARLALQEDLLLQSKWLHLHEPLKLLTHVENKPWGRELWYTGIEKRGVSGVETAQGERLSLAEYLALFAGPEACASGDVEPPSLLKILDPLPLPERGSLYIEVHREKWETYIVTSVDAQAWPDGRGEILFGYSSAQMAAYGGRRESFLNALQKTVEEYEAVRRQIDATELEKIPSETLAREKELWLRVRQFFEVIRVDVGTVIAVPPLLPHSLQYGVRVVEFQTPTYERLILAFNQKVQTQSHWNTREALEAARFESGTDRLEQLKFQEVDIQGSVWEQIVDFPQFKVLRRSLVKGENVCFASGLGSGQNHSLFFVISGRVVVTSPTGTSIISAGPEESLLLPHPQSEHLYECRAEDDAIVLLV
ncbi:MAG: hypothetical protein RIR26_2824 [Pseudomonadota bacterium]